MRVHFFILSVTMVNITNDSSVALLSKPVENVPRHTQSLIYYMFLAAKIAWKSPALDIVLIKRKLTWIMLNGKISECLARQTIPL